MLFCAPTLVQLASAAPATPDPAIECHRILAIGTAVADLSAPGVADPLPEAGWSDLQFVDLLIGEAALAIHVAGNGFQRADDSDVRRIALRILESQAGEAKLLRLWRQTWFPDAPPLPDLAVESTPMLDPSACIDGKPSDAWLLSLLIETSERSASAARFVGTHADRPELRNLASVLLEAREAELRTMQTLLEDITTTSYRNSSSSPLPRSGVRAHADHRSPGTHLLSRLRS